MMKAKIFFGISMVSFIFLASHFFINVDEIPLGAKLFLFTSLALLIAGQGFILYHFGKGVRFQDEQVIIPSLFGDFKIERDQILAYQATKSFWGLVFDHSLLTIKLKNGESSTINVPDSIIDALKSKV